MPPDNRKDRADCPGELDGVCVKMMQKDPRYRYANCLQVAEILEAWLAKYRKETEGDPSKNKNNNLSVADLLDEGTKKSKHDVDTVANRGNSTKVAIGSSVVSLSASDSGVLRAIAKSEGSSIDSNIDLVHDSNKPNAQKSKSQAIAKATSPISNTPKGNAGGSSPLLKPIENGKTAGQPAKQVEARPSKANPKQKSNVLLFVGVGVVTLVLFAGILFAVFATR
jgi:serine/threonine-protein kinase